MANHSTPAHDGAEGKDPVTDWLNQAYADFFAANGKVDAGTVKRALVGLLVVAAGIAVIVSQVL